MKLLISVLIFFCIFICAGQYSFGADGIIAHWDFNQGNGEILKDASGNGNDGKIVNADWVKAGDGYCLRLKKSDSYVDFSSNKNLTIKGDAAIEAWVKLEASRYPNPTTNWYIVNCEKFTEFGFRFGIIGRNAVLFYCCSQHGAYQSVDSKLMISNNEFHHLVVSIKDGIASYYIDGVLDSQFSVTIPAPSALPFLIGDKSQSFEGLIDDIKFYHRSLSANEVIGNYKSGAEIHGKDASWFGKLSIKPFYYFADNNAVLSVDYKGILPVSADESIVVNLTDSSNKIVSTQKLSEYSSSSTSDFKFDLKNLPKDKYSLTAVLLDSSGNIKTSSSTTFNYPHVKLSVPSPKANAAGNLPKPVVTTNFKIEVTKGGGIRVNSNGKTYPVETLLSFPNAGDNKLLCLDSLDKSGEATWKVRVKEVSKNQILIKANGNYYSLEREIKVYPNRISIKDKITNKTQDAIGLIVKNQLAFDNPSNARISGYPIDTSNQEGSATPRAIKANPTVFVGNKDLGAGLVALDDVFIVQSMGYLKQNLAGLSTESLAIDKGSSYTLEWAIYLNSTGDYYDFINEVRKDENRNIVTVPGNFAGFLTKGKVPTKEWAEMRGLGYVDIGWIYKPVDDPQIYYNSFDLVQFPKEMELLKQQCEGVLKIDPNLKPILHIAHSLYVNNKPEQFFPDSRVILENGTQAVWGMNYFATPYYSEARAKENWRLWIYYPTLENSYGKAMLKSIEEIKNKTGIKSFFMDGFMIAYGSEFVYDRWDGHTAEIDPTTYTIKRKLGSVLLLSQDSLVALVRKVKSWGGDLFGNGTVVTRTIGKEQVIEDLEMTEGPGVHLAQTPITMGNPSAISNELDIYKDVQKKLKWGNLYIWYGEWAYLTRPSVPNQMFPITVQEIHSDYIKGKERLVTALSGVYGWENQRDLHYVYLYDARGREISSGFWSTADSKEVRTELKLDTDQMAVVKRLPIFIASVKTVNVRVEKYDAGAICIELNSLGKVRLLIKSGDFKVRPNTYYKCSGISGDRVKSDSKGMIALDLVGYGPHTITISKSK